MPRLYPFPALRYTGRAGDLADLLAPPYDVIDPAMASELRTRGPYNSVRLVLPEGDVDTRYEKAASLLESWVEAGVLDHDPEPAFYVYRQDYEAKGERRTRHALFGALDLVPLDRGEVLPHERTHAGPKRDRLALMLAARAQLSPVFMAGRDPSGELLGALRRAAEAGPPDAVGRTPDGTGHALWRVPGARAPDLARATDGYPLLIADGHHRYETALEAARHIDGPEARQVLVCVVSEADPGLVIEPTHRTLTELPLSREQLLEGLAARFDIGSLDMPRPAAAAAHVASRPSDLVMFAGEEIKLLTPRPGEAEDPAAGIAAVCFDRHVLSELLGTTADAAAHDGILEYHRNPEDAVRRAEPRGVAFLLPPVGLEEVWRATATGFRLPPKSTYFEPKMPSGLLFRSLGRSAARMQVE